MNGRDPVEPEFSAGVSDSNGAADGAIASGNASVSLMVIHSVQKLQWKIPVVRTILKISLMSL